MNWKSIDFDWNQVRAFLATVEEGSLSAAARALGVTQPTVGRQVAALEAELNVSLFERTGRMLRLTAAAEQLLEQVRTMAEAANEISLIASGQSQSIEGCVRITASDIFSSHILAPLVEELQLEAPRLGIEIVAANDLRDLQAREADIAIRHVRPQQRELVGKKLGDATASLYAARSYVNRCGAPCRVETLSEHRFVYVGDVGRSLGYMRDIGLPLTQDNFKQGSDSGLVAWDLVKRGLGIMAMSDYVAQHTPDVVRLDVGLEPIRFPVWVVTHRELRTSARIRLVFDRLVERLEQQAVVESSSCSTAS